MYVRRSPQSSVEVCFLSRQWWLYPKDSSTRDRSDERDNCRKRNVQEDEEGNIGPHGSALDFGLAVLYKNPISEHGFDYATPSRLDLPSFRRQQATYRKYSYYAMELFETIVS